MKYLLLKQQGGTTIRIGEDPICNICYEPFNNDNMKPVLLHQPNPDITEKNIETQNGHFICLQCYNMPEYKYRNTCLDCNLPIDMFNAKIYDFNNEINLLANPLKFKISPVICSLCNHAIEEKNLSTSVHDDIQHIFHTKCLQDQCGDQEGTNCPICKKVINCPKIEEIEYTNENIPQQNPINNFIKNKKENENEYIFKYLSRNFSDDILND